MAAASGKVDEVRRRLIPRVLEPHVVQLRRDLRSIIAGIRGERPPAYLVRDGARYAEARGGGPATRTLELAQVRRETADAFTLRLRDPDGAELPPVRAGQFFTLLVDIDGEQLRRAYSVSSDCRERSHVELTIKRVADGRVSSWLHQHAAPGMRLRVLGPSGEFGRLPSPVTGHGRELLMIAGGSGITPMMAMLRTLLPTEAETRVTLIYANRSLADVIFADALAELELDFAPRLQIIHVLEQPPAQWTGPRGRCDAPTLAAVLDQLPQAPSEHVEVLVCGPTPMMDGARALLRERGVADSRVHVESFVAPRLRVEAQARVRGPQPLTVVIGEREVGLVVRPGQTLLEAGLAAQLALPYSCTMGGCGACKIQLERGEVVMSEPNCLSADERERGYVLACVANPISPCRVRASSQETP